MTKAVVIRTVGDPQICGAIVDGMTKRVYQLNDDELAAVKAELARLRRKDAIRACGDEKRFQTARAMLAIKYSTEIPGRLYEAILGAWGLLWLGVFTAYTRLAAWNREE